jgi:hypothetical protein
MAVSDSMKRRTYLIGACSLITIAVADACLSLIPPYFARLYDAETSVWTKDPETLHHFADSESSTGKKEISMLATTDRNLKVRLDTATAGKMHFSGPTFNFGA